MAFLPGTLFAQELPRPSMARHQDQSHTLPTDYNMKLGPVLFNFNSSLGAEYVDNVGLSTSGSVSDFLLTPTVGIQASWPVTQVNTLTLSTSLGYTKYLTHPQYDTSHVLVSPDSRFSFDVYVGDFKINLHDDFSYQQDPVGEAALSNVVNFDRFQNVAGVTTLWDLNKVLVTLNYDHINFISSNIQNLNGSHVPNPGALDYTADQVSASAELHISSTFMTGLEAAGSVRSYDQFSGDYTGFSAGPFMKLQVTDHIKAMLSGGYRYQVSPANNLGPGQLMLPGTVMPSSGGVNSDSYYADLTLDHEVNKYYIERLSLGHDIELGLLGEQSEISYVNYTSSWHVNKRLNLALTLGYQNVNELGGLVGVSSYDFVTAGVQASFPVTKSISGAVYYQFNDKLANAAIQNYQQNRVGVILTYHF